MLDILVENVLDNTTFKSPNGNVPLELNDKGKELMDLLKELLLEMSTHHRWQEEHKIRIITSKEFTDFHMGKFIPEEEYDYYSIDGDYLFSGCIKTNLMI